MQINGTMQQYSTVYCNLVAYIVSAWGNSLVFHIVTERVQSIMYGYFWLLLIPLPLLCLYWRILMAS